MPDLKSDEAQAERKKRRTAEKEASRWRKKAAELQELVEQMQQHSQQPQVPLMQACICHSPLRCSMRTSLPPHEPR